MIFQQTFLLTDSVMHLSRWQEDFCYHEKNYKVGLHPPSGDKKKSAHDFSNMTSSRIWQILQVLLVGLLDYTCCDTNNFLAQRESISNRSHSKSVRYGETSGARVVRNVLQNMTIIDPLHEACKHSGKEDVSIIRCYLCKSNTKAQKEPKCDTKLWKYLKHSETTRLK